MEIERYNELKSEVDRLRRDKARAEGALSQTMGQLEQKFGVKTIKQAERMAVKLRKEADSGKRKFGEALSEFEKKWSEKFGDET